LRCSYNIAWDDLDIWRMPMEPLICNGVIRRTDNKKRGRRRLKLIWMESVKRDLNDWCITKKLVLDRREWKLATHVSEPWSSISFFYCLLLSFFSTSILLFWLSILLSFLLFYLIFLSSFVFPFFFTLVCFFAHVILSLVCLNLLRNKMLGCDCVLM
jgi:hypothetical protein